MAYRVASVLEFLVITGAGIPDVKITKQTWVVPRQSCTQFDVSSMNYTFKVQAMSIEMLPFVLPAVFTIGPRVDDEAGLLKYAKLLATHTSIPTMSMSLFRALLREKFEF